MYKNCFKRVLDLIISFFAVLILSPFFIVVIVWLTIANKGAGAFFLHERPGKDGKLFKVIKFKSMTDERDAEGKLLPNEQRVTKIGKLLRKTSIDELPQLFNVLKGDMSFVGPRPLVPRYLALYTPEQARRHEVRPGITGWAQVNGRNSITWIEKFKLDVWYVDHCSLCLDVKILWMTMVNVLKGNGIDSGNGKVGAVGFNGTN